MARLRLFPHRTADPESVVFGEWWIEREGGRIQLPNLLPGWDYAREEVVGLTLTIDENAFLCSTGLQRLSDVEVLLLADCQDSQTRVVARHGLEGAARLVDASFGMVLPPQCLAGTLTLTATLILGRDLSTPTDRSAYLRGARIIWSKPTVVALEGVASRFPTDPVAFSSLHLPDAPWTLHMTFDSLSASFMSNVRFLVNTEHPVGRMLLDSTTVDRVTGLAMADVMRLLIATTAAHAEDLANDHEEGSVAYVVDSMCELFLGRRLNAALQLYLTDPIHFDALLYESVRPLAKAFE